MADDDANIQIAQQESVVFLIGYTHALIHLAERRFHVFCGWCFFVFLTRCADALIDIRSYVAVL